MNIVNNRCVLTLAVLQRPRPRRAPRHRRRAAAAQPRGRLQGDHPHGRVKIVYQLDLSGEEKPEKLHVSERTVIILFSLHLVYSDLIRGLHDVPKCPSFFIFGCDVM